MTMLVPPLAALSPASCCAMPSPAFLRGSSIPLTPSICSEADGQPYGQTRAGTRLLDHRGWPSAPSFDDSPAPKRPRVQGSSCQAQPVGAAAAAAAAVVAAAATVATVAAGCQAPPPHPTAPSLTGHQSCMQAYSCGDPSHSYVHAGAACFEPPSACLLPRSHLQHQQQHQQHHHRFHHHCLPHHQCSAVDAPSCPRLAPEAGGVAVPFASLPAAAGCATFANARFLTGAGPTWGGGCRQMPTHRAPPPPPQQQQQQQPHNKLQLQLLLTVHAASDHFHGGTASETAALRCCGLSSADACFVVHCSNPAAPLRFEDFNSQAQLYVQQQQQTQKQQQQGQQGSGHWHRQLPPQGASYLPLALRPLASCHHLSSPSTVPTSHHQQWQPLPLPPPPPPLQQQQQQQQRRPCIPFFAPTTPPLDADAPSECILLLCKALCMSEGTTGRLALHIWNRIRGLVRLLVSVRPQAHRHGAAGAPSSAVAAAAAADRVYSVAAVWLASKLEETRREVPTVHTLAAAARTLPSVLIAAELRVLQWCEWAPYLGFVPDDSYLLIDL